MKQGTVAVMNTHLESALVALLLCHGREEHEDGSHEGRTHTDEHCPVHGANACSRWRLPLEVPEICDGERGQGHCLKECAYPRNFGDNRVRFEAAAEQNLQGHQH